MNISTRTLFYFFLLENIIDSICTVIGINNGAIEMNPFVNFYIGICGPILGVLMAKLIAIMGLACMLKMLLLYDRVRTVKMILWLGVIVFGILVFIIHPYVLWIIFKS